MGQVILGQSWINLASDPSQGFAVYTSTRSDAASLGAGGGKFRMYANGRVRLVLPAGDLRSLPMTLRNVSDATLTTLDTWRGRTLLFRDRHGRRMWGSFLDRTVTDYPDGSGHDVTLTFTQLTYSEAV